MSNKRAKLLYILGGFPRISETFIQNEIYWLQDHQIEILPIALCKSSDIANEPRSLSGDSFRGQTIYARDYSRKEYVFACLRIGFRRPFRFLKAVRANLELPHNGVSLLGRLMFTLVCTDIAMRNRVDHIHAHWDYPSDIALLTSIMTDITFSLTAHAHDVFETGSALPYKAKRAKFIVTCTEYNRSYLVRLIGEDYEDKVIRVYHGLEPALFLPCTRPDHEVPIILGVGRLVRYKGFHRLVEACRQLKERGYSFRCMIVGGGSQYKPLQDQINSDGLQSEVKLLGPKAYPEVIRLYDQADIFVLPADVSEGQHGLPNVLIEAMARGLAVVTSKELPPIGELIDHDVNGFLVPTNNIDLLGDTLGKLIADRDLRRRVGETAAESVQRFDIDRNLPELLALFSNGSLNE